jgi:23S rRNA pseudouridine1911/1915/1917 synthase
VSRTGSRDGAPAGAARDASGPSAAPSFDEGDEAELWQTELEFDIGPRQAGQRLDVFLAGRRDLDLTRSHVQKLIAEGLVTVDGEETKAGYRLRPGDRVVVSVPYPEPLDVEPEAIPLDIVYEDEHLVVVNKPRGMVVHPAPGHSRGTLVNALLAHCDRLSGIGGVSRPGIVHRLDKDTSGVMVVAKTDRAHLSLAEQIKNRTAHRRYLALVHGDLPLDEGTIETRYGRDPVNRRKMAVLREGGKEAVTHYRVLERFGDFTLIECALRTGRTHQIRVHLAHVGHPVAGDPLYGPRRPRRLRKEMARTMAVEDVHPYPEAVGALEGQALHAHLLTFRHPVSDEPMEFRAPMPADMERALAELRARGPIGPHVRRPG